MATLLGILIWLRINTNVTPVNHLTACQYVYVCKCGQDEVQTKHVNGEGRWFKWVWHCFCARGAGLIFCSTWIFYYYQTSGGLRLLHSILDVPRITFFWTGSSDVVPEIYWSNSSGLGLLMLLFSLEPIWTPQDCYICHNCGLLLLVSHNYVCARMFQIISATCLWLSLYAVQALILHTATYWIVSGAPLHRCNLVLAGLCCNQSATLIQSKWYVSVIVIDTGEMDEWNYLSHTPGI